MLHGVPASESHYYDFDKFALKKQYFFRKVWN